MASTLFDPMLELALSVAKKGASSTPSISPPPRLVPMLSFAKLPERAKDAVLAVLDSDDEFRRRVADAATEKAVGRTGLAYLERGEGWDTFVNQMLAAADEPVLGTDGEPKKLSHQLDVALRARERAEDDAAELRSLLAGAQGQLADTTAANAALVAERDELAAENAELVAQRQRAVAELKRTEEIMARHVAERKRLEAALENMTAAQLSTAAVGGGVTDDEVRLGIDVIEGSIAEMQQQLATLRRAATPERVPVARRTPLPVPGGLLDDSSEYADYLLSIPKMIVIVDGYNVTKLAHDDWDLERQREWLEQQLRGLCRDVLARFDVVFDGGDVVAPSRSTDTNVRVRFSPGGVEADDVIIDSVSAIAADRAVTVVSSDNRVRSGATERGANVLHSRQLIDLFGSAW